ncbi:TOPRIM nucleotidyl transferase/hydrolase domain-containing protein [Streptomyces clavifer]|uniref:ATP-dependent nuclease n=1 Tax=Streptomyces clavifer TaxID=68188 RepID=UPI00331959F5
MLDEPGVHIEPTLQRRITQASSDDTQCLVITHSADLVPVSAPSDLSRILRLSFSPGGSKAHRAGQLEPKTQARWLQVLGLRDTRSLLFCAGAVLCEGATEVGGLGTWWESSSTPPSSANFALIDVGGDKAFGRYIEFLEAFQIPWAVIADGPALHPGSSLHRQLKEEGLLPATEPDSTTPVFGEWKDVACGKRGNPRVPSSTGNDMSPMVIEGTLGCRYWHPTMPIHRAFTQVKGLRRLRALCALKLRPVT